MKVINYRPPFVSRFQWFLFRLFFPVLYADYIYLQDSENRLIRRIGCLSKLLGSDLDAETGQKSHQND